MVFPGHFSSGCLQCRQRKVKCDEGKPSCHRCDVYGTSCPGYTDTFQFRKHSDKGGNAGSSSSRPSSKSPRANQEKSPESDQQPKSWKVEEDRQVPQEATSNAAMHCWPDAPPDEFALSYFFLRFVSPQRSDGFPGYFSFLPSLYDRGQSGLLEAAALSVAHMATYNRIATERYKKQSYLNYGRAIEMLQITTPCEGQPTDDKVLAAVLLLCTLDDIIGEGSGVLVKLAPTLLRLIEKRGKGQIETSRGVELLQLSLSRLQTYAFLYEDDAYSDPGGIAATLEASDPLLRSRSMISKTLLLRHTLRSRWGSSTISFQEGKDHFFRECFTTLGDFQIWDVQAASHWQKAFQSRGSPPALGQVGSNSYDPETACIVIQVRSARLILLSGLLAYLGHSIEWLPCISALEQDLAATINDILGCAPYALGDIGVDGLRASTETDGAAAGALAIVHGILLVAHCDRTTLTQLEIAEGILARIGHDMGIKSALGRGNIWVGNSSWAQEQERLRCMVVGASSEDPPG